MLTKPQKQKIVADLAETLQKSGSLVLTDFTGLTMAELTELKRDLKKEGITYQVLKKSLLKKAFEKTPEKALDISDYKGSVALASGDGDPAVAARKIYNFGTKIKKLSILGGFLMGEKMSGATVTKIAKLPGRSALIAQVLQLMMSPVSGLARVISGIAEKKDGE